MSLIKWTPMFPFEDFDRFFDEMMPSKKGVKGFMPAVDVYEKNKNVVVEMPLANIDPDKIDISIENDVLHVKGSTEKKSEVDDKNYYRKEISSGSFYRTIPLPASVVADKTSAVHENGVLKILMPKAAPKKEKKIKVQVKKGKAKKKIKK